MVSAEEAAADCPYINEYCRQRHNSAVKCSWTPDKGRILTSQAVFRCGDVVFREPPLHIVAEQKGNPAFDRLKQLITQRSGVFDYEPLWYWTALCSLKPSQLKDGESRFTPITEDQQRKLLLLYHAEVTEPSEAAKLLVAELGLAPLLDPLDLERLLQIWILNCFEHTDEPLGYSAYFMSSFMSHSCLPNAVWHYDGDVFVLRARSDIAAGDEISVSYLSEDALLEATHARRKHLKDSKHFVCACVRCTAEQDFSRGFRCQSPTCKSGTVFYSPRVVTEGGKELVGAICDTCGRAVTEAQALHLLQEERWFEGKLEAFERRPSKGRAPGSVPPLEEMMRRAEKSAVQHYLLDKAWQLLSDAYDKSGQRDAAEECVRKRMAFQARAYPALSGTRAWTLEAYGDMLLKHNNATLDPAVKVESAADAKRLQQLAQPVYGQALGILRLMFGETHEYFTSVHRKETELAAELQRLLGIASKPAETS